MKCVGCNTKDNIVMSGVDSLVLECMELVERVCYDCANRSLRIKKASSQPIQA